jgi:beta-lactamase class A
MIRRRTVSAAGVILLAATASSGSTFDAARRQQIESVITQSGADVAVAFRTLDGGEELFLRDAEPFHAASTMKVPVMIELFRQAWAGLLGLDQGITVTNEFRSIVDGSPYSLSAGDDSETDLYQAIGQTRTYRELCELMITRSSNLATNNLIEHLGVDRIRATAAALGAPGMDVRRGVEDDVAFRAGQNNTTSARALLVLLEALAGGKAVSAAASLEMVEILERQQFNESIPAGLPPGTRVAHKTGSITRIQHDAAIVYGPRAYVLVVLVRGLDDEDKGHRLIADIARIVEGAVNPPRSQR